MSADRRRLIVGITGASGAVYGVRLLELLRATDIESHLIISRAGQTTLAAETSLKVADLEALADVVHANADLGAACSSGSFRNLGMVIAPCSIKTMSEIATGVTANLISRAADVALKERRRVVLDAARNATPSRPHRAMAAVTETGAIVYPPVPAFYAQPKSLEDMIDHTLGRVLDLFDIDAASCVAGAGKASARKRPRVRVPAAKNAPAPARSPLRDRPLPRPARGCA
jgi:4-hydroxy-3-polyprenylbenzoate decarboxylase